ncbi:MAG: hypothetical protein WC775_04515 [Patescibacteria group bacterium]|jgi:hypothetical protein
MHHGYHIVFIPGLHDQHPLQKALLSLLPSVWRLFGLRMHIVYPEWEKGNSFTPKLERILAKIDSLLDAGYSVAVAGQSAGGSAAGNAFIQRKNKLAGFVNITGRLKEGNNVTPTLAKVSKNSPAFAESVRQFERDEKKLSKTDRKRMLTIRPLRDYVVPAATAAVAGGTNLISPFPGHATGGIYINIFYARRIREFLENCRETYEIKHKLT